MTFDFHPYIHEKKILRDADFSGVEDRDIPELTGMFARAQRAWSERLMSVGKRPRKRPAQLAPAVPPEPGLLRLRDAADLMGIDYGTLRNWIRLKRFGEAQGLIYLDPNAR